MTAAPELKPDAYDHFNLVQRSNKGFKYPKVAFEPFRKCPLNNGGNNNTNSSCTTTNTTTTTTNNNNHNNISNNKNPYHVETTTEDLFRKCRVNNEISLPKTFTTRKGALLLFSEDLALRNKQWKKVRDSMEHLEGDNDKDEDVRENERKEERKERDPVKGTQKKKFRKHDVDRYREVRTVGEFAKTVLAFGNSHSNEKYARLVTKIDDFPRQFRPGFSAKRYLSIWSKYWDQSTVDQLVADGHLQSKPSLDQLPYSHSSFDDISSSPLPYRLLHNMLLPDPYRYTFAHVLSNDYQLKPDVCSYCCTSNKTSGFRDLLPPLSHHHHHHHRRHHHYHDHDHQEEGVPYQNLNKQQQQTILTDYILQATVNTAFQYHHQHQHHQQLKSILATQNHSRFRFQRPVTNLAGNERNIQNQLHASHKTAKRTSRYARLDANTRKTTTENTGQYGHVESVEFPELNPVRNAAAATTYAPTTFTILPVPNYTTKTTLAATTTSTFTNTITHRLNGEHSGTTANEHMTTKHLLTDVKASKESTVRSSLTLPLIQQKPKSLATTSTSCATAVVSIDAAFRSGYENNVNSYDQTSSLLPLISESSRTAKQPARSSITQPCTNLPHVPHRLFPPIHPPTPAPSPPSSPRRPPPPSAHLQHPPPPQHHQRQQPYFLPPLHSPLPYSCSSSASHSTSPKSSSPPLSSSAAQEKIRRRT
ncbi:lateral signaling target protein 2 homolog [Octopus sinensis]|uniref:Lateral signaling target protein 2 homolog n=1 Tax=Octopus sinensis TaxID=2607531 RepID=A0A7E6FU89_9MOLL|nr:lateral signaling target protein 2 homolog [Octopus sinensis]